MSFWKFIVKVIDSASSVVAHISSWVIFGLLALISTDVILRYFFNNPLLFSVEISSYMLIFICFFGAAQTLKERRHIVVDILTNRLKPKVRLWLELITSLLSLVVLSFFLWQTIIMVRDSFIRGVVMPTSLLTPIYLPQMMIPLGIILLWLQYTVEIGKSIRALREYKSLGKA